MFTDKLDDAINELFAAYSNTGFWRSDKARQQILAAIAEVINQQKWVDEESPYISVNDLEDALGIEKGEE